MDQQKYFYSPNEVAERLGVTDITVKNWIKDGKLFAIKTLGGWYKIPRTEVERILKETIGVRNSDSDTKPAEE